MADGKRESPVDKFSSYFTPAVLVVAGVALFWFWGLIVPFVLMVLADTLYAILFGLAIAAIIFVLINPQWRALFGYLYKSLMRMMVSTVVMLDPIGVMKGYRDDAKKTNAELGDQANKYDGQIEALAGEIERNEAERIRCLQTMKQAEKHPDARDAFQLAANQAGRLLDANKDLQKQLDASRNFQKTIDRMRRAANFMEKDLDNRIVVESRKRKLMQASYGIFKSFKKLMKDGSTEREMFDMALEANIEEYDTKMGEIKSFVKDSEGFLQGVDLQNGVYVGSAKEQMDEWDKKSHDLLVRVDPNIPTTMPPAAAQAVSISEMDDLFSAGSEKSARR